MVNPHFISNSLEKVSTRRKFGHLLSTYFTLCFVHTLSHLSIHTNLYLFHFISYSQKFYCVVFVCLECVNHKYTFLRSVYHSTSSLCSFSLSTVSSSNLNSKIVIVLFVFAFFCRVTIVPNEIR